MSLEAGDQEVEVHVKVSKCLHGGPSGPLDKCKTEKEAISSLNGMWVETWTFHGRHLDFGSADPQTLLL